MRIESSNDVKVRFKTREGVYDKNDQFGLDESKLSNASYSSTAARSLSMPVVDTCSLTEEKMKRLTLDHNSDQEEPKSIVYCTGKDVFHYHLTNSDNVIDRRSYKGGALPSTLKICEATASSDSLRVAIGFTAGQLQIIDMATNDEAKRSLQKMNDEKTIDNAPVTVIQWIPDSQNRLLAANQKGNIYLYNSEKVDSSNFPNPIEIQKSQSIPCFQYTNEKNGNPEQKWTFGSGMISAVEFSPDGRNMAVASRDGFCFILENKSSLSFRNKSDFNLEFKSEMRSYFGGFLCCAWSPSGRFLAAGGEDDLISVMNTDTGRIMCRCQGHHSWIASIAWDPFVESPTSTIDSRIGSVGQDGILCFWELANDVMFPRRTRTFSESERINAFNARNGIDPNREEDQV